MFGRLLPFAVLSLTVSLLGCSGSHSGRLSNDPADYAKTIKKRVKEFLASVKENPKATSDEAAVLLETLEAHTNAPVGDYKSTYELLTQKCKELVEAAKSSPSSAQVQKLLQDMDALANQLPGDVSAPNQARPIPPSPG